MANTSIFNAFERMWQHITTALNNKSNILHKHSWYGLNDKPFGEMETGGDTFVFDGNADGLETVSQMLLRYYLVSEVVPTMDDLQNGTTYVRANGQVLTYDASNLRQNTSQTTIELWVDGVAYLVIALQNNVSPSTNSRIVFPKKGIWVIDCTTTNESTIDIASLTIPGFTGFPYSKDIDEKYIPDTIARVENIPMLVNVEYKTTEQFLGKPVYTKVVDCGALVDNDVMEIPHGISDIDIITDMKSIITSEPRFSNYAGDELPTNATDTNIFIDTIGHDAMVGKTVAVVIKYTK